MFFHILMLAIAAFGVWTCLGSLRGAFRFRYWPLLILAFGYGLWAIAGVGTFITSPARPRGIWLACIVLGTLCIFGYRLAFYRAMRARGIHPKQLFGIGAS